MLARFGCGNTNNGGLQAKEEELTAGLKIPDDFLARLGFEQSSPGALCLEVEDEVARVGGEWET